MELTGWFIVKQKNLPRRLCARLGSVGRGTEEPESALGQVLDRSQVVLNPGLGKSAVDIIKQGLRRSLDIPHRDGAVRLSIADRRLDVAAGRFQKLLHFFANGLILLRAGRADARVRTAKHPAGPLLDLK